MTQELLITKNHVAKFCCFYQEFSWQGAVVQWLVRSAGDWSLWEKIPTTVKKFCLFFFSSSSSIFLSFLTVCTLSNKILQHAFVCITTCYGTGKREEPQKNPNRAICEVNTDVRAMWGNKREKQVFSSAVSYQLYVNGPYTVFILSFFVVPSKGFLYL